MHDHHSKGNPKAQEAKKEEPQKKRTQMVLDVQRTSEEVRHRRNTQLVRMLVSANCPFMIVDDLQFPRSEVGKKTWRALPLISSVWLQLEVNLIVEKT